MLNFILGAFLAFTALVLFTNDPQPNYDQMMETFVRISVNDLSTIDVEDIKGSGFISDTGYIITAAHVIGSKNNVITGKTKNGKEFSLKIVKIIPEKDLAVLKTTQNFNKKAKLSCESLKIGQKIVALGNPSFLDWIVTTGTVAGERRTGVASRESIDIFIADISLAPGMSGGPVFDMYGDVVGLNDAIVTAPNEGITETFSKVTSDGFTGISVIVSGEAICEELRKLPKIK